MKSDDFPNREQFDEYFRIASLRRYPDLAELAEKIEPLEEPLTEFFCELWKRSEQHRLEVEATEVHKWLTQQGNYKHALRVLYHRSKAQAAAQSRSDFITSEVKLAIFNLTPLSEESLEAIVNAITSKVNDQALAAKRIDHFVRNLPFRESNARSALRNSSTGDFAQVEFKIASAISRYLQDGHAHQMKRKAEIELALGAINEIREKYRTAVQPALFNCSPKSRRPMRRSPEEQIEDVLGTEERVLRHQLSIYYPGRRHDPIHRN